jgi:hypothetical protein
MKCANWFWATMLIMAILTPAMAQPQQQDMTKAIVVTYLFKDGSVSYVSSRVVYGYAPNNVGNNDFMVNLLGTRDATLGSYGIGDPRILYHEDGADILDEVEFTVILPFSADAREVRIYDRDGTTVVSSADISGTVSSFCSQNPNDPDCGGVAAPAPTGIPLNPGIIVTGLVITLFMLAKRP